MGGQQRKRPHFVDDVPVEDDLIDQLLGHGALHQ